MSYWSLRGTLPQRTASLITGGGAVGILLVWWLIVRLGFVNPHVVPSPFSVVASLPDMAKSDHLFRNMWFSMGLNMLGYLEAIAISIPIGMVIGLFPIPRYLLESYFSAGRFLPLPAAMGLFITAFGIYTNMKVQFLCVGIAVYLIPAVIGRVRATDEVYIQMAKTLGASRWQRITSIFIPDVLANVMTDIRVLIAISWTYITVNEVVNMSQGGLGALASIAARQGKAEKTYAVLLLIILIGFLQDRVFVWLDKRLFKWKYV